MCALCSEKADPVIVCFGGRCGCYPCDLILRRRLAAKHLRIGLRNMSKEDEETRIMSSHIYSIQGDLVERGGIADKT